MRLLIRTVIVLAIVWIGLLLSGYGVLMVLCCVNHLLWWITANQS